MPERGGPLCRRGRKGRGLISTKKQKKLGSERKNDAVTRGKARVEALGKGGKGRGRTHVLVQQGEKSFAGVDGERRGRGHLLGRIGGIGPTHEGEPRWKREIFFLVGRVS